MTKYSVCPPESTDYFFAAIFQITSLSTCNVDDQNCVIVRTETSSWVVFTRPSSLLDLQQRSEKLSTLITHWFPFHQIM